MEFKNLENLEKELNTRLKSNNYNLEAYLNDIENSLCVRGYKSNGSSDYELGRTETKSGNAELIKFDIETKFPNNMSEYEFFENEEFADENMQNIITTLIF